MLYGGVGVGRSIDYQVVMMLFNIILIIGYKMINSFE